MIGGFSTKYKFWKKKSTRKKIHINYTEKCAVHTNVYFPFEWFPLVYAVLWKISLFSFQFSLTLFSHSFFFSSTTGCALSSLTEMRLIIKITWFVTSLKILIVCCCRLFVLHLLFVSVSVLVCVLQLAFLLSAHLFMFRLYFAWIYIRKTNLNSNICMSCEIWIKRAKQKYE